MPTKRQLSSSSESPTRKKPINFVKLLANRETNSTFRKNTLKNSHYK
jgi:hypothetical protein